MNIVLESSNPPKHLGAPAIAFLALTAALATSTSYLIQPELRLIAGDLRSSLPVVSAVAASSIMGYMLGLALLVPLVDHLRANQLVAGQLTVLGAGLIIAAIAKVPLALGIGLFVSGVCASTGAQLSTLAGKHSAPPRRGRALGTVTAGISAGILLGRIIGGALADWIGWRPMLLVFSAACVLFAVTALRVLPGDKVLSPETYSESIRSVPKLLRRNGLLRAAAISGALWFFSFCLVWVGLALALALPPLNLPPAVIGLYSLAGLLGIAATRVAGSLADRYGSRRVILAGLALSGVCAVTMMVSLRTPGVLLVALALFDAGLFAAQVANQSRVLGIDPARPARFNSAYLVIYFVGGSIGTAVGGTIVSWVGWPVAAAMAAVTMMAAALIMSCKRADAQ